MVGHLDILYHILRIIVHSELWRKWLWPISILRDALRYEQNHENPW